MKHENVSNITVGLKTIAPPSKAMVEDWDRVLDAMNVFLVSHGMTWDDVEEPGWWSMVPSEEKISSGGCGMQGCVCSDR